MQHGDSLPFLFSWLGFTELRAAKYIYHTTGIFCQLWICVKVLMMYMKEMIHKLYVLMAVGKYCRQRVTGILIIRAGLLAFYCSLIIIAFVLDAILRDVNVC